MLKILRKILTACKKDSTYGSGGKFIQMLNRNLKKKKKKKKVAPQKLVKEEIRIALTF